MTNPIEKYCIIREYKSEFNVNELMKRIIRIHIKNNIREEVNIGCSDHEVKYDK
jgi:hypothetical protein